MGFLQQAKEDSANAMAANALRNLKPQDGKVHVIMLLSFSQIANVSFGCDKKYTLEIDAVLSEMQELGYEIVDIKFSSLQNQGLTKQREGYITCIMYK